MLNDTGVVMRLLLLLLSKGNLDLGLLCYRRTGVVLDNVLLVGVSDALEHCRSSG
jgi:hypothetical protein